MSYLGDKVNIIIFMQKQAVIQVFGQVQGVSFRYSTQQKAEELNLAGWVKNEPNGSVKIVAEGEEKDLNKLIEWCKGGEGGFAKVAKVEVDWSDKSAKYDNFTIKF